jgi:scpA/B protein
MTFHELVVDAPTRAVVVSRFLALLELYRRGAIEFEQDGALGTLTIQWTGSEGSIDIDVDDYTGAGDADLATASSPSGAAIETQGGNADE